MEPSLRESPLEYSLGAAADKAADLAAIVEAVPIEDLGVHLGASALAEPAHGRLFDESCVWLVVFSSSWFMRASICRMILR